MKNWMNFYRILRQIGCDNRDILLYLPCFLQILLYPGKHAFRCCIFQFEREYKEAAVFCFLQLFYQPERLSSRFRVKVKNHHGFMNRVRHRLLPVPHENDIPSGKTARKARLFEKFDDRQDGKNTSNIRIFLSFFLFFLMTGTQKCITIYETFRKNEAHHI